MYGLLCCSVSRFPIDPKFPHVAHPGIKGGVRVSGRNRQNLYGRDAGFRCDFDFGDQEPIYLVDLAAVWTLHRDFAIQVVVGTRKRFGPDHTETVLAILARKRIVAWHWELLHRIELQVGETGGTVYFFSHKSQNCFTVAGPWPA
jgi:hypothetical protein